jgi:hypothetical protein
MAVRLAPFDVSAVVVLLEASMFAVLELAEVFVELFCAWDVVLAEPAVEVPFMLSRHVGSNVDDNCVALPPCPAIDVPFSAEPEPDVLFCDCVVCAKTRLESMNATAVPARASPAKMASACLIFSF